MDLGMAVMTAGDAVIGTGGDNLVELDLAVGPALIGKSRLQETTATAATVIIRFVRSHFDDVFRTDDRGDNESQIIGNRIAKAFTNNLTGILDGELYFPLFVPVGINLQSSFPDPFRIILIDGGNFKIVFDVEFFQSSPD